MVSEDSDQLQPGLLAIHRLSYFDDLQQPFSGQMATGVDKLNAPCKLLEVLLFRGVHRMRAEERDDDLEEIIPPPHDEAIQVFLVVVVPGIDQHLADTKECTEFVQTGDALRPLRYRELVRHLIAGFVAFSTFPIGLSNKADGEASFPVYKTKNPAELNQPFLLIVRTQHVVTTFRLVVWDTRVFQHMAEC
jgi:hypothetical protein